MTKFFRSLISVFLAVFMVVSLAAVPSSAATIKLSKTSITLTKGYQTTLSVSGTSKTVQWSTGDKSIATVSSAGKVVGKKPGTTYIYAKVGGSTLKCKVQVVAAKITSSTSSVTLDKRGASKTVTVTVKGSHSKLSVATTDKSVASASWVKPVEWDGDKIKFRVTANGPGNARIKVYLQDYPSTCCKYIDVAVGGSSNNNNNNNDTSTGSISIIPYDKNVEVSTGGTYALQVFSSNHNNLAYTLSDTSVAYVTAGNVSGYYRNFNITGLKTGTTTLRLYDKNNTNKYVDVKITVSNTAYYEFYTTMPSKQVPTDQVMTIQVSSSTTYYMLVPANYDPAYTNTLIGKKFSMYQYYEVYDAVPSRRASTDTYTEFYHSNSNYKYGVRYVLLPKDYDKVKLNTIIAQYNNKFEYWTVYSVRPTMISSWDIIETWQITDPSTGKISERYLLVPVNGYDVEKIKKIKDEDLSSNSAYTYYVGYTTWPTVNNSTDKIITYRKGNESRYMVVPKDDSGIAKANDAIAKDTGIYEYNVIYSVKPTATGSEKVIEAQIGISYYYVLVKSEDAAPDAYVANRYADGIKDN